MSGTIDLEALGREVEEELHAFLGRRPAWAAGRPYTDPSSPLGALERRESERLARLERRERHERGERARERQARERTRPWREQDRFGLRKRVWRERRDRERTLLDRRERAVLERERELLAWLARHEGWLRELRELEPEARYWCAEQEGRWEREEVTPELLAEIQRRRQRAGAARARELLAREDVRAALRPAVADARDPFAAARAATPILAGLVAGGKISVPVSPVLLAAVALELARGKPIGIGAGAEREQMARGVGG